jgi:hypothetical protein
MKYNILKNINISLIILLLTGCENTVVEPVNSRYGDITIWVELIESIDVNSGTWQSIESVNGIMLSSDVDVKNIRIEWSSNLFWIVGNSSGYFKLDCRTCDSGLWYDDNGSTQMDYNFHTMSPVTNQVSIVDENGNFKNIIAPVSSMENTTMMLWWNVGNSYIDSMEVVLN